MVLAMKQMIRTVLLKWGGKYSVIPYQFEATYSDRSKEEQPAVDTSFDYIDIDVSSDSSTNIDVYDIPRLKPDEDNIDSSIKRRDSSGKIIKVLGAIVDVKNNTNLRLNELGVILDGQDTLFISMEKLNVGDRILVGDKITVENYHGYLYKIEKTEQSVWENGILTNCKINGDELLPELFNVIYEPPHTQYSIEKIDKQVIKSNTVIYLYNVDEEEVSNFDFREVIF